VSEQRLASGTRDHAVLANEIRSDIVGQLARESFEVRPRHRVPPPHLRRLAVPGEGQLSALVAVEGPAGEIAEDRVIERVDGPVERGRVHDAERQHFVRHQRGEAHHTRASQSGLVVGLRRPCLEPIVVLGGASLVFDQIVHVRTLFDYYYPGVLLPDALHVADATDPLDIYLPALFAMLDDTSFLWLNIGLIDDLDLDLPTDPGQLFDAILIKDNHINAAGSIKNAVRKVKSHLPNGFTIEVEVKNLVEVKEALDCDVNTIMLDNMGIEEMQEAVALINKRALVEASGGVKLETVEEIARTGVDYISVGALTHSVRAVDMSLRVSGSRHF